MLICPLANSNAAAYTPHPCSTIGESRCTGITCGAGDGNRYKGTCDKDGCDFNSYRMGDQTFLGPGKTIDTSKKLTIVTQFIGNPLNEIKRFYVQNGKVVPNSQSTISGVKGNSVRNSHFETFQVSKLMSAITFLRSPIRGAPLRRQPSRMKTRSRRRAGLRRWAKRFSKAWFSPSLSGTITRPTCSGSTPSIRLTVPHHNLE
jgi:hypothetical protein